MNNTYRTILDKAEENYTEKRSKFISVAYPVVSVDEVKQHLDSLKKKYYDARHICWAYMLGPDREIFRINDDGEPSGTAGKPILGQINSNELTNILVVVIRYFGGIKLGTGGLAVAYREATSEVLKKCNIVTKIVTKIVNVKFQYLQMNDIMKIIKDGNFQILKQEFDLECALTIEIPQSEYKTVLLKLNTILSIKIEE